jgi:hypothetical protein
MQSLGAMRLLRGLGIWIVQDVRSRHLFVCLRPGLLVARGLFRAWTVPWGLDVRVLRRMERGVVRQQGRLRARVCGCGLRGLLEGSICKHMQRALLDAGKLQRAREVWEAWRVCVLSRIHG